MPAVLALALAGSALAACADRPLPTSADLAPLRAGGAVFAKAPQVSMCHRTGSGSYILLTINGNAVAAHQAHGDAAPGAAVPDGSGARFGDDCVPRAEDVTGTYVLDTVGGKDLPTQGNGEIMYALTIELQAAGSCSISGVSQPGEEIVSFTFQACSYSLDGTELTLDVVDERGEEFTISGVLEDEQIIVEILVLNDGDPDDEGQPADAILAKT